MTKINHYLLGGVLAVGALSGTARSLAQSPAFWQWAPKPVMGWNSWDFYGTSVTETNIKAQASYMANHLLSHGWNLITVDIQWYQPTATGFSYINGAKLTMDQYGRLLPATNRFPSAIGGQGFKPLADYVHSLGLKFGIHMMRGIPRQAVAENTPILGTTNTADQIADTNSRCAWNSDMYGVDMSKPGAQAYYNSLFKLYASWGVDFVKIDDLSRPYHKAEIEAIRQAIDNCGRHIIFSTSPGATPLAMGSNIMQHANQWRIADDFWDNWNALYAMFKLLDEWTPFRGPGHFPDADMLPIGKLHGGSPTATGRSTYFTTNEQYTLMSLWSIARSPLILGADMTQMDPFTLSLLTNDEVIAVDQDSQHNHQLFRTTNSVAWTADAVGSTDKYLAVFNISTNVENIPVNLFLLGYTNSCAMRSLWEQKDLGSFKGTFSPSIPAHGAALYQLSGPTIPVPWVTNTVAGSNQVTVSWEAIPSATSYNVKRSTAEEGPFQTIASGLTTNSYTDSSVTNGNIYYYAVTVMVGGQESPASEVLSARPEVMRSMVSWNYDVYGTVPGNTAMAGVQPAANWNNSWPDNPTLELVDNTGVPTSVDISYNLFNGWNIQNSHPGVDADGFYNRELLNGYLNAGDGNVPTTSSVSITQIPFSYYDLYVYFSSDTPGRSGTVTDGNTTYSFTTMGGTSINGVSGNAVLTPTTDTGTGSPSADYAVFSGLSGSSQTISCYVPQYGGIAGFQLVSRTDPLPNAFVAVHDRGTGLTLSWPQGLGNVVLEKSSNLRTWMAVSPQPQTNSFTFNTTGAMQFFRLARP